MVPIGKPQAREHRRWDRFELRVQAGKRLGPAGDRAERPPVERPLFLRRL